MVKTPVKKTLFITIILIAIVIALNYITALLVNLFKVPLFLDTWGTSLGVLVGGFGVGAIGGVLYNLIMAATVWGPSAWVWSISSLWIAISTYFFLKHGFLDIRNIKKLIFAGLVIGFTNALITFEISVFVFNSLPTYEPTEAINNFFFAATGNHNVAVFLEHITVELFDKTASLFIAVSVFSLIPFQFIKKRRLPKAIKVKRARKVKVQNQQ